MNAQHRYGTRSRAWLNLILLNGRRTKTGLFYECGQQVYTLECHATMVVGSQEISKMH
jgi:hypothetical protein